MLTLIILLWHRLKSSDRICALTLFSTLTGFMQLNHFSQFLNDYRFNHMILKFKHKYHINTPILTIAFNTGVNSTEPFNRAVKTRFHVTPGQNRKQLMSLP